MSSLYLQVCLSVFLGLKHIHGPTFPELSLYCLFKIPYYVIEDGNLGKSAVGSATHFLAFIGLRREAGKVAFVLEDTKQPRMVLNSCSSHSHFPGAGIMRMSYHT